MKVCPECRSRYEGDLSFCPTDGTRLVDISQVAEDWTGRDLTRDIHLGDFWESTPAGDRYIAHDDRLDDRLLATVLNRRGRRTHAFSDHLRDILSDRPPQQILGLRDAKLTPDGMPPWVVEEHPRTPSLRHRLDQLEGHDGALNWEVGVRIAITAGRLLHWMAQQDCVHAMWHPGAVYCDDAGEHLRIGDWVQGAILAAEQQDDTPDNFEDRWLGFEQYMAPELFDDHSPDGQTLVYGLGIVLYESIVGHTPFHDADDLTDAHRHASRPAIADNVGGVHPELDDILGVMLAADRSERFDHPEAASAALASLLSASLKTVAPDPAPRDDTLFPDTDTTSEDSVHELSEPVDESNTGETLMGMPAADSTPDDPTSSDDTSDDADKSEASAGHRDSVVSGETESVDASNPDSPQPSDEVPTIIIDDNEDTASDEVAAGSDDSGDDLAETVVDDATGPPDDAGGPNDSTDRFTRLNTGTLRAWHRSNHAQPLGSDLSVSVFGFVDIDQSDGQTRLRRVNLDDDATSDDSAELPPTIPDETTGPNSDGSDESDDSDDADQSDQPATDTSDDADDAHTEVESGQSNLAPTDDDASDSTDTSTALEPDDANEDSHDDPDDDLDEDFDGIVGDFDRGSPEIDDPDDFENEWFSKSSEDAWMEQDVREGRDQAEETRRYVLWVGLSILAIAAASVVIYAEFGPSDASPDTPNQVAPNGDDDGSVPESSTD